MIIFIMILGACLGSFCASLASRIVEKKPLFTLHSFCFSCGKKIRFYELVPILSYVFLRAKCSNCKCALPFSLLINEILGIILLVLVYFLSFCLYDFLLLSLFLFNFFLLSLIDMQLKAVPQSLLWSAFLFALFYSFKPGEIEYFLIFKELKEGFFLNAFNFAGFIFLLKSFVFYLKHFQNKNEIFDNLGDADIIIMAGIAGILGFEYGFLTLFLASLLTLPFFVFLKNKALKTQELAMIPFLNIAFIVVLFYKNSGLFS
ncbi:prepilin peptidase [Campylobacter sp. VicNov18]|uniref:prepilin peptidase n=1 Tax=Campylobacter bilis TaxID=2691918 RepID=UPI00130E1AA2|nr:A24 family peptidase [Campylobacter bilis]MPV63567.1 prepilin peptidase [Campylobacter hepaticus]MBM0637067.1 prepilin peptidase [Campylobacter bilis]MCC8277775.1 prepilin peptidase [Campylobacter bilis]MCC8299384.1 prepilin peptidase [Campylobacter bilis]MCC8300684.1 prepilin peptidase [Campylobacter bilis]